MKKQLFDELVSSIKEAGRIHRGEARPPRSFVVESDDIRRIRKNTSLKSEADATRRSV